MDAAIKEKWVKALRSGEYKQGRCSLRDVTDCHCCLGVLCDLHGDKWDKLPDGSGWRYDGIGILYLPDSVRKWADIPLNEPHTSKLMGMNDQGVPFAEIADYIEVNL